MKYTKRTNLFSIGKLSAFILIVALVLLVQVLCVPAAAASEESGTWKNLSWHYSDGILTISGNGSMENFEWYYEAPWAHLAEAVHTIDIDEGVTSVGDYAFTDFKALTTLTLPHSLTRIGHYAFFRCEALSEIYSGKLKNTLPENLEFIGTSAFCRCYWLEQINMGPKLSYLNAHAFSYCYSLETVVLSSGLNEISDGVFSACTQLRSVVFPASIASIGEDAFAHCNGIKYLVFEGNAPEIHETAFRSSYDPIAAIAYYPSQNSTWTNDKLVNYGGMLTWKAAQADPLPSNSCGKNLDWYFTDGTLVIYGTGPMLDFHLYAAPWAGLADKVNTIYIQDGVTTIGNYAFEDFRELTTVRLPGSLTEIGDYAFSYCVFLSWVLDSDLQQRIPNNVVTIGEGAFHTCMSLNELTLGANVTSLGDFAFQSCVSLKQIILSASLDTIGTGAFQNCSDLSTISVPEAVTYIGNQAFAECGNLKIVIFNGNAPQIHNQAFYSGFNTTGITAYYPGRNSSWTTDKRTDYGGSITWIEKAADCVSLGSCGDNLTWELKQDGTLYIYGFGAMYDYNTIDYAPWYSLKEQITAVVIEEGVTTIGETAFYKLHQLTAVTIPDSVTIIEADAFFDCPSLVSIYISKNVTYIGENAFLGCDALQGIEVAADNAYYTCDSYGVLFDKQMKTLIASPGTITGHYTIPYGVEIIEASAFYRYGGLTGITIPSTVTTIGNGSFSCCFYLKSVTIPASVTLIDHAAFWYCHRLEEIIFLGDAPEFVEEEIFVNVSATAYYPAGNMTWTEDKFIHPGSNLVWVPVEQCQHQWTYTYAKNQSHSFSCDHCGHTIHVADQDGQKFGMKGASPVLSDDIVMVYETYIPAGFENAYMVFEFNGTTTTVTESTYNASNGRTNFRFPGLNPQKMGDNIHATLYATVDGYEVSIVNDYSMVQYCDRQLKNASTSAALRTALSDLLVYGKMNQIYEGYKTDALCTDLLSANAVMTPSTFPGVDASWNVQGMSGTKLEDCTFTGVDVTLGAKIVIGVKVTCVDTERFSFKVNIGGVDHVITGDMLEPTDVANKYVLKFDKITAVQLGETITFSIWEGDTQVSRSATYSVYSYIYKNQNSADTNLANLLHAIYNYGEAVKKIG